jgi:hypothetical protein
VGDDREAELAAPVYDTTAERAIVERAERDLGRGQRR